MAFHLACVSHGPALTQPMPAPPQHETVLAAYRARAEALQRFAPDLVIMFAPDHYTGVHLEMVPPFCVGFACEAVADVGGTAGRFDVPAETAKALVAFLREADLDPAASYGMVVDHGFSQPLARLAGGLDRYPVIPIFINTTCKPSSPFRRVRLLGEAVGRFARGLGKRVAFLGSGGISHHPVNIFPPEPTEAAAAMREYLLHGGMRGGMSRDEWIDYVGTATRKGGERVMQGQMVASDFRINPAWDGEFLHRFAEGDLAAYDPWDPEWVVREAGVGAMEVQQWIAAAAAAMAAGTAKPVVDLYVATVEYRIAVGVAHADMP